MPPVFEKSYCPFCGEELDSKMLEGKVRDYCEACERVIWRNAEPVSAVIVRKQDRILFVKRGIEPGEGEWSLPAGFLEYREQPEEGAVRELEEETGLKADKDDLNLVEALNIERFKDQRLIATVYEIEAEKASGEISAGSDAEAARYWSIKDLRRDENEVLRRHFMEVIEGFN